MKKLLLILITLTFLISCDNGEISQRVSQNFEMYIIKRKVLGSHYCTVLQIGNKKFLAYNKGLVELDSTFNLIKKR